VLASALPEEGRARSKENDQVCANSHATPKLPPLGNTLIDDPLGIPPAETQDALKADAYKELINKISWALGSTYRVNYSNTRMPARGYAQVIVGAIVRDHGFPRSLGK